MYCKTALSAICHLPSTISHKKLYHSDPPPISTLYPIGRSETVNTARRLKFKPNGNVLKIGTGRLLHLNTRRGRRITDSEWPEPSSASEEFVKEKNIQESLVFKRKNCVTPFGNLKANHRKPKDSICGIVSYDREITKIKAFNIYLHPVISNLKDGRGSIVLVMFFIVEWQFSKDGYLVALLQTVFRYWVLCDSYASGVSGCSDDLNWERTDTWEWEFPEDCQWYHSRTKQSVADGLWVTTPPHLFIKPQLAQCLCYPSKYQAPWRWNKSNGKDELVCKVGPYLPNPDSLFSR